MIAEFGVDAYPEIGIVKTEIVEVVDQTPNIECEEGETWRAVIRENLVVEVEPEARRESCQSCAGHEIEVAFHHFLRPEAQFDSMEALAAQIQRDCDEARKLLSASAL